MPQPRNGLNDIEMKLDIADAMGQISGAGKLYIWVKWPPKQA
jgi:hypothetical protein